jgi:hypothetical protein
MRGLGRAAFGGWVILVMGIVVSSATASTARAQVPSRNAGGVIQTVPDAECDPSMDQSQCGGSAGDPGGVCYPGQTQTPRFICDDCWIAAWEGNSAKWVKARKGTMVSYSCVNGYWQSYWSSTSCGGCFG